MPAMTRMGERNPPESDWANYAKTPGPGVAARISMARVKAKVDSMLINILYDVFGSSSVMILWQTSS